MNKRAREIIGWIIEKHEFRESCTLANLIQKFDVSERIIRYDLEDISEFLSANKQEKIQLGVRGSIVLKENTDKIKELLIKNDFYTFKLSKEERMDMIKYLTVNTKEYITLQQIADILFVSRSTIIHDVEDIRNTIGDFDLEIVSLRKGLCMCGKESRKRILLLSLLRKPFLNQYRHKEDARFMFIGQDETILKQIIKDVELDNKRFLTDGSFEDLKRYCMIMMERFYSHQYIEIDYISQHSSMAKMAKDIMDKISDYFGMYVRLQEKYVLADIIYNLHFLKRNDVDEKTMQVQVVSKQFINAITKDLHIDLNNDF